MASLDEMLLSERLRQEQPLYSASTRTAIEQNLALAREELATSQTDFSSLRAFCLFIGYSRSGHSLIGSLLDAHRNIAIAHELDALEYIRSGCTAHELFTLLFRNSVGFSEAGRQWGEYRYAVADGWQGRVDPLLVIGDKKGRNSTALLAQHPGLLDKLKRTVGLPVRCIHVVRNPYDMIATTSRKNFKPINAVAHAVASRYETNKRLIESLGAECVLTLWHEDTIADPARTLKLLASFLGVAADMEWIEACARIVSPVPHESRHDVSWPEAVLDYVDNLTRKFDFLGRYSR